MLSSKISARIVIFIGLIALQGCHSLQNQQLCPGGIPLMDTGVAGYSLNGTSIHYSRIGCGPRTALVYGAIHGDEPASATLTHLLTDKLKTLPVEWKTQYQIITISVLNPDGLDANTRGNSRGVDLNRNFPTANRINNHQFGMRALSEPEAVALVNIQRRYPPTRVIAIHQPLACIDHDGPAEQISLAMGRYTDLPQCNLGARPGSHGSYTGVDRQTPIVTFEMKPKDHYLSKDEIWQHYGKAIMAGITYPTAPPDL